MDLRVLNALRERTADLHAGLEAVIPVAHPAFSRDAYPDLLARFYGVYAPLEAGLWSRPEWVAAGLDPGARRKTPLLAADLAVFGRDTAGLPLCAMAPPATFAAALGVAYVVEGATLGGKSVSALLAKRFGLTAENGGRFFHGYGEDRAARWRAFHAVLNAALASPGPLHEAREAAAATFACMIAWFAPFALSPAGAPPRR